MDQSSSHISTGFFRGPTSFHHYSRNELQCGFGSRLPKPGLLHAVQFYIQRSYIQIYARRPYQNPVQVNSCRYLRLVFNQRICRLNSLRDRLVQNCGNEVKYHPCSAISLINQNNEVHKLNRFEHTVHRGPNVTVLVDMADLQSNSVTYRIGSSSFQEVGSTPWLIVIRL